MSTKKSKILILIIVVAVFGFIFAFVKLTGPVDSKSQDKVIVSIAPGSATEGISNELSKKGLVTNKTVFKLYSKIKGYDSKYKAGTYVFTKSMSMNQMMVMMKDGKTSGKTFMIIEGMTIDKIASQLEKGGVVSAADFYYQVENGTFDYWFLEGAPPGPTRLEGFLYPNTYEVGLDATAYDVVDAMLKGYNSAVKKEYYEEAKKLGKTWREVMTVASIVEREAAKKEEKPKVASVIYNRLEIKMPLQMDSIIAYIHKEDKIRATYQDIAVDSPYNPYTNVGLPPGPICSPGIDAIEAALRPEKTKYIYFVAKPALDGSNVYSETYEDFLVNKAAFDKAYEQYIKDHPGEK